PHENRWVIHDRVIDAIGKILLQLRHGLAHILRKLNGVGAGYLKNRNRYRALVIQQRAQRVAGGAEFDSSDVFQKNLLPIFSRLHDDSAELLLVYQAALRVDEKLKRDRTFDRLLSHRTGGYLDVLFANRRYDFARGETFHGDLVRVEPNPHRIVARAEQPDRTGAGNSRQH